MHHLTFFDNISIIILLLSFFLGIFKGLIATLLDLILFIVTIFLTLWLLPYSYELLHEYVNNSIAVNILGGIICYVFSIICISLLSKNIKNMIKPITGGVLDRSFGGLVGIFRAFLIINIIFMFGTIANDRSHFSENNLKKIFIDQHKNNAKWLVNSYSFNMINTSTKTIIYFLPNSLKSTKFSDFELYKSIFGTDNNESDKTDDLDTKFILNSTEELNKALGSLNLTTETGENKD